jgi:hypothetical protein
MLKLTQAFLLTDGNISRASSMRAVFEDDRAYENVFRRTRLRADARKILVCYKVQFRAQAHQRHHGEGREQLRLRFTRAEPVVGSLRRACWT